MSARSCTNEEIILMSKEIQDELGALYESNRDFILRNQDASISFEESPDFIKIQRLRSAAEGLKTVLIMDLVFRQRSKSIFTFF